MEKLVFYVVVCYSIEVGFVQRRRKRDDTKTNTAPNGCTA